MEEKQVLDPHEDDSLVDPVRQLLADASPEERMPAGGSTTPRTSGNGEGVHEEQDWQTTEVRGQRDADEAADADTEDVTDDAFLDLNLSDTPLPDQVNNHYKFWLTIHRGLT